MQKPSRRSLQKAEIRVPSGRRYPRRKARLSKIAHSARRWRRSRPPRPFWRCREYFGRGCGRTRRAGRSAQSGRAGGNHPPAIGGGKAERRRGRKKARLRRAHAICSRRPRHPKIHAIRKVEQGRRLRRKRPSRPDRFFKGGKDGTDAVAHSRRFSGHSTEKSNRGEQVEKRSVQLGFVETGRTRAAPSLFRSRAAGIKRAGALIRRSFSAKRRITAPA